MKEKKRKRGKKKKKKKKNVLSRLEQTNSIKQGTYESDKKELKLFFFLFIFKYWAT